MAVYRIDLAYDGTGFRGWARNAGVRTVQGAMEDALAAVLGEKVSLSVAGRTDAGVHARRQVASFESPEGLDGDGLGRSLRRMLGPEISVRSVTPAPEGFDARFSATARSYRYFVEEAPRHDPLRARWVWHLGETLDLTSMNQAGQALVGEHDFASLCRSSAGRSTVRRVLEANWQRDELLTFGVTATAFCQQMVRSMVALLVDVGRGKVPASAVPAMVDARDRSAARGVAPPHGLILWEVSYG